MGVMCTCITFRWTTQLFNTTFIGPMAFGGRYLFGPVAFGQWELCVLVLHYAGPDSYLALLSLVQWHL